MAQNRTRSMSSEMKFYWNKYFIAPPSCGTAMQKCIKYVIESIHSQTRLWIFLHSLYFYFESYRSLQSSCQASSWTSDTYTEMSQRATWLCFQVIRSDQSSWWMLWESEIQPKPWCSIFLERMLLETRCVSCGNELALWVKHLWKARTDSHVHESFVDPS